MAPYNQVHQVFICVLQRLAQKLFGWKHQHCSTYVVGLCESEPNHQSFVHCDCKWTALALYLISQTDSDHTLLKELRQESEVSICSISLCNQWYVSHSTESSASCTLQTRVRSEEGQCYILPAMKSCSTLLFPSAAFNVTVQQSSRMLTHSPACAFSDPVQQCLCWILTNTTSWADVWQCWHDHTAREMSKECIQPGHPTQWLWASQCSLGSVVKSTQWSEA